MAKNRNPYQKTDKTIAYLNKQFNRLFRRTMSKDELNVIQVSHEIYDTAYDLIEKEAARLVDSVYNTYRRENEDATFDATAFVVALLLAYSPVTKYVFKNEIDRKRARFAESVLASDATDEEIALAKRLLVAMNAQFLDDATFDVAVQAYKDNGAKFVRWETIGDDRRCKECRAMDGKIYPIDKIPAKPHHHCRCWVVEVSE